MNYGALVSADACDVSGDACSLNVIGALVSGGVNSAGADAGVAAGAALPFFFHSFFFRFPS